MLMLESLQFALRSSVRLNSSEKKPRLRKIHSLLVACGALCYSAFAPALGLGDITLHSALNQPLDAEITLVEPGDLAEGEVSVSLATAEEFSRAGVERVFFLNDLRFTPILRGNRSVIRVVSNKPVNEPFLNFLVQVNQPNGRLLREYTVLIDPPGSPGIVPSSEFGQVSPATSRSSASAPRQESPLEPPPPALQGKRYTVVNGDNLWIIVKRLRDAGSKASTNELMLGIRALNPGGERLAVGQSLLLPDMAVQPKSPEPAGYVQSPAVAPPQEQSVSTSEQLAASVLENQHLQTTVDDQQTRLQAQDEQIAAGQKAIIDLQTQLAEVKRLSASPAAPVTPVVVNSPLAAPQIEESGGPNLLVVAGLVLLLLLLILAFWVRRQRHQAQATPQALPVPPVVHDSLVSRVAPRAQEQVAAEMDDAAPAQKTASPRRERAEESDVLEGVSLYVAYGRLGEAVGILREALLKQPERLDLGMRLLEILGQQGDEVGYAEQESRLLESGVSAQTLQDTRARFTKLSAAPVQAPPAVSALAEAEVPASPVLDEFQLNLEDLSMDTDWDLISPFDTTPPLSNTSLIHTTPSFDPGFTSNLKVLPEVFEMSDEPFLSDFSEAESDLSSTSEIEALGEAFLDSFASGPQELEVEPLSVDFDTLERQRACAHKLEQAQTCIDEGDLEGASRLLNELLEEGDESLQQTARHLLASIR
ncbi:FimV/HubP family polar landmark protein [Pseudomonas sp. H11T01]|uniref:FimV/HubP family polar landmark protein n=1 Tax=Pseudomonas sp. H11T01 TaxID=3402749 RepID=UPI003ACFE56C